MKRVFIFFVLLLAFAASKRSRESDPMEILDDSSKEYVLADIITDTESMALKLLNNVYDGEELNEDEEEFLEELEIDVDDELEVEKAIDEIEEDEGKIVDAIEDLSTEIVFEEVNERIYEKGIASEEEIELEDEEVFFINDMAEEAIDSFVKELTKEEREILGEDIAENNEAFEEYVEDSVEEAVEEVVEPEEVSEAESKCVASDGSVPECNCKCN